MTTYTTPGWFDLQVNGYGGHDYNAPGFTVQDVQAVTARLARSGVAHHLPTLITATPQRLLHGAGVIAQARREGLPSAVPGFHLEGPFISTSDGPRGAHPLAACQLPHLALIEDLQDASQEALKLVTLAPELPGSLELISALRERNIAVAIGHSDADSACVIEAVQAGAQMVTHFGNGIRAALPRHPNLLWTALAQPLILSLILDGHHLGADISEVAYRVKGAESLCLVSDSVALAGSPPGLYRSDIGDQVELLPSGRLQMAGTPYLAGSSINLLQAVQHAALTLNWPLAEVLKMVTATPRVLVPLQYGSSTTIQVKDHQIIVQGVCVDGTAMEMEEAHV